MFADLFCLQVVASFSYPAVDRSGLPFAGKFGISVLGSNDGKSKLEVTIDCSRRIAGNVQVSTTKEFCTATCGEPSKLFPAPLLPQVAPPPAGAAGREEVHLHVIVDHSIIECIFNNRTAMAVAGVGGKSADDTNLGMFGTATDPSGVHGSLKAWQLDTANTQYV